MELFNYRQPMRIASVKLATVVVGAFFALAANATSLLNVSSTGLTASDPTQLGRLSRDGVPSDWSTAKTFPGVINTATSYHYETFTINTGAASFIEIMFASLSTSTFASAYLGSYSPTDLSQNYLGDDGTSGDYFSTDPLFFQVVVPAFSTLVIVINETLAGGGLGQDFRLLVDGYVDTEYTDVPVPEPATAGLFLLALLSIGYLRRKDFRIGVARNLSAVAH